MTEAEAKTRWCPMVRFGKNTDGTYYTNRNDEGQDLDSANCIGSACMMWRWHVTPGYVAERARDYPREALVEVDGHCGLAGKPDPEWFAS